MITRYRFFRRLHAGSLVRSEGRALRQHVGDGLQTVPSLARCLTFASIFLATLTFAARTGPAIAAGPNDRLAAGPPAWADDLSPIAAADWSYDRAAHLIERAGFGATPEEVARLAAITSRSQAI